MKNKNRPKREKQYKKPKIKKHKPFNPWIIKYFDLTGNGIESRNKMKDNSRSGGLGFCSVLTIVFIVLKLCDVIHWSWIWVLSPSWIPLILVILFILYIKVQDKGDDWFDS